MKRFLSLFIALILVFSMFAVTAVAFAEDTVTPGEDVTPGGDTEDEAARKIEFAASEFKSYVFDGYSSTIEMSKTFMLDGKINIPDGEGTKEVVWYQNQEILHKIFPEINYIELKDEDFDENEEATLTLTYSGLPEASGEEAGAAEDETKVKKYHATEHVTLDKTPTQEGKIFDGWEIKFDGRASEYENYRFAEGFTFNMPKANVEIIAHWIDKAEEGAEQQKTVDLYANDVIYVLYNSSDSRESMDKWERCLVTKTFSVTTDGWWEFRFAVGDGIRLAETDHVFDWDKDILATTYDNVQKQITEKEKSGGKFTKAEEAELLKEDYTLRCRTEDTTNPEIKLSSTMENKQTEGLTAGTTYSISTALDIEDASSTTVTYVVYKKVGDVEGAENGWLLIYDSKTGTVTEGYEDNISTSGVITPLEEDITGEDVYKIVYTAVDRYGNHGVKAGDETKAEYHPEMLLKVKAKVVEPGTSNPIEAWKIVLYVIAGLSAVGIVVLLCIKPKQADATDARYNASANETAEGGTDGEQGNSTQE